MEIAAAVKLAKDQTTQSQVLDQLCGLAIQIDRLLAMHKNSSETLLLELSKSEDRNVLKSLLANPNTPDQAIQTALEKSQDSWLRDEAIARSLTNKKSTLPLLDRARLLNFLSSKSCPDIYGKWAAKSGDLVAQSAYLFSGATNYSKMSTAVSSRPKEVVANYCESGHPDVIQALMQVDDDTYFQWAKDIGVPAYYQKHDDGTLTRETLDMWSSEAAISNVGNELCNKLVPHIGSADSVQGELIRAATRLHNEYYQNSLLNWPTSNTYKNFAKFINKTTANTKEFSPLVGNIIKADIDAVKSHAEDKNKIKGWPDHDIRFGSQIYQVRSVEEALGRLVVIAIAWSIRFPELIPFKEGGI